MGDFAEILVAVDCDLEVAAAVAERVLAWLIDNGIVEGECREGRGGYPPGPRLEAVAAEDTARTRRLGWNGLEIEIGRRVFDNGENGLVVRCSQCEATFEPQGDWIDAVGAWFEGSDDIRYACPSVVAISPCGNGQGRGSGLSATLALCSGTGLLFGPSSSEMLKHWYRVGCDSSNYICSPQIRLCQCALMHPDCPNRERSSDAECRNGQPRSNG